MINNILPVHKYRPRSVGTLTGLHNIKKASVNFVPKTSATNNKDLKLHEIASAIKSSQNKDVINLKEQNKYFSN